MEKKIKIGIVGSFVSLLGIGVISNWNNWSASKNEPNSEHPFVGDPCSYDEFRGECKITSVFNENKIKFNFIPIEHLNLENTGWIKNEEDIVNKEYEEYSGNLGLECLDEYPITKEDLERCNIKKNVVFDCGLRLINKGTCSPINFKFYK